MLRQPKRVDVSNIDTHVCWWLFNATTGFGPYEYLQLFEIWVTLRPSTRLGSSFPCQTRANVTWLSWLSSKHNVLQHATPTMAVEWLRLDYSATHKQINES